MHPVSVPVVVGPVGSVGGGSRAPVGAAPSRVRFRDWAGVAYNWIVREKGQDVATQLLATMSVVERRHPMPSPLSAILAKVSAASARGSPRTRVNRS